MQPGDKHKLKIHSKCSLVSNCNEINITPLVQQSSEGAEEF